VASWSGFGSVDGMLLSYEVQVRGSGVKTKWLATGVDQMVTITDLQLAESEKYAVSVRATDAAGRKSAEKLASVMVDVTPPTQTQVKPCAQKSGKHVKINWSGVFTDKTPLRYELSIGKTDSFGDFAMRLPVDENSYLFLPKSLGDKSYFLTITAIDGAGYSTTSRTAVVVKEASESSC